MLAAGIVFRTVAAAVTIAVHPDHPGIAIPRDFLGFSFEAGTLTSAKTFPAENLAFQRLVKQVGPGLLRFGGGTVDRTGWQRGTRTAKSPANVLFPADVDRVFAFARATGYRVLFALNLGSSTKEVAADEAAYVVQAGGDALYGLEIGNEPNVYSHDQRNPAGEVYQSHRRPPAYSVKDYIAEHRAFAEAIHASAPAAVLTGPAVTDRDISDWTIPFVNEMAPGIAMITQHFYSLRLQAVAKRNAANAATIPNLLSVQTHDSADASAATLERLAQSARLPWRMAECNSCNKGGQAGVSDVFASALWGVDYLFTLASRGAAGVNLHAGPMPKFKYTPVASTGSQFNAQPLYYGMLLFHVAAQGRLVPLEVNAPGVNLTAYAVLDDGGTLRVTVINKDVTHDANVEISPGAPYARGAALKLAGPSLDATSGTTLGGSAVQADGSWTPGALEDVARSGATFHTTLKAGSAAMIRFADKP